MADQKISELTNILGSDVGAGDEFVVVDSSANETKAITTLELRTAIGNGDFTVTGDLTVQGTTITVDSATAQTIDLGDNDKMQFGDGNDLQIYHDGLHSYIDEAGTGDIYVSVLDDVIFRTYGTNELVARFNTNQSTGGWARLYHRGSEKLETTSTGIDVTGTVTADKLTLNNASTIVEIESSNTNARLDFIASRTSSNLSSFLFKDNADKSKLSITQGGDISFYEDTGTTAKFFWDASAESLGIGTTSPSASYGSDTVLEVSGSTSPGIVINDTGQASKYGIHADSNDLKITYGSGALVSFQNDGNVGIGTSSPNIPLEVKGRSADGRFLRGTDNGGTDFVDIGHSGSLAFIDVTHSGGAYHDLAINTGGSEAMRIDSSGNVGIGTSSPSGKLDVSYGDYQNSGAIKIGADLGQNTSRTDASRKFGAITAAHFDNDEADLGLITMDSSSASVSALTIGGGSSSFSSASSINFQTSSDGSSAGTTAMRIDSSGNVGIGYTTPSEKLGVNGFIGVVGTHTSPPSANPSISRVDQNNAMGFFNNSTERMRIDSSGNLLVGKTSSLTSNTRAEFANTDTSTSISSGAGSAISIQNLSTTNNTYSSIYFTNGGGGVDSAIYGLHEVGNGTGTGRTGSLVFATANLGGGAAERMRIDSSGNLLVGVTSSSANMAGLELAANGQLYASTSSSSGHFFNRQSTDGDIVSFRKDGTTVGSIGAVGSDIYVGTTDTNLRFADNLPSVIPVGTAGATRDATINLGSSGNRFKDLYLSGGVYLGGTGSANLLDDYEEGTWNATDGSGAGLTLTLQNNTYTKVGRLVTCAATVTWPTTSSTSIARLTLPFTSVTTNSQQGGVVIEQNYSSTTTLTAAINYTDGVIFRSRGYTSGLTNANLSGKKLRFILTYHEA